MILRNFLENEITRLEWFGNHLYEHRINNVDGSSGIVFCTQPNSITVINAHTVSINSQAITYSGTFGRDAINAQYLGDTITPMRVALNNMLNVIQQIKHEIDQQNNYKKQISDCQNNTKALKTSNEQIEKRIASLLPDLEASKLEKVIDGFSLSKKAHILTKIWMRKDAESSVLKNLILQKKFNANYHPSSGEPLVKIALQHKDATLLKHLLNNGLKLAGQFKGDIILGLILQTEDQAFANVVLGDTNNKTEVEKALFCLLKLGKLQQLKFAFSCKHELVSAKQFELTLLQAAIKLGQIEIAKAIIDEDASTSLQTNSSGQNAVAFAVHSKNIAGIKLLQDKGVDFMPELTKQVALGNTENIKFLLVNNEQLQFANVVDQAGNTILHLAAVKKDQELLKLCLDKYPEMKAVKNSSGQVASDYAIERQVYDLQILDHIQPQDQEVELSGNSHND